MGWQHTKKLEHQNDDELLCFDFPKEDFDENPRLFLLQQQQLRNVTLANNQNGPNSYGNHGAIKQR